MSSTNTSWLLEPMVDELFQSKERALEAALTALKDLPTPSPSSSQTTSQTGQHPLQVAQVSSLDDLIPYVESQYSKVTSSPPKKIKALLAARLYGHADGATTTIGQDDTTVVVPLKLTGDPKLYIKDDDAIQQQSELVEAVQEELQLEPNHCLHVIRKVDLKIISADPSGSGLVALFGIFDRT